jgi:hypothetical protein
MLYLLLKSAAASASVATSGYFRPIDVPSKVEIKCHLK